MTKGAGRADRLAVAGAAALVVFTMALGACGGSDSGDTAAAVTPVPTALPTAIPTPTPSPTTTPEPTATAAPTPTPSPTPTAAPTPTPSPSPTPGPEAVYVLQCAACHGLDGLGSDRGPSLRHAADFHTLDELIGFVRDGRREMPAFANVLTEEQIVAVTTWVVEDLIPSAAGDGG